jgi:hypothetical protein
MEKKHHDCLFSPDVMAGKPKQVILRVGDFKSQRFIGVWT